MATLVTEPITRAVEDHLALPCARRTAVSRTMVVERIVAPQRITVGTTDGPKSRPNTNGTATAAIAARKPQASAEATTAMRATRVASTGVDPVDRPSRMVRAAVAITIGISATLTAT